MKMLIKQMYYGSRKLSMFLVCRVTLLMLEISLEVTVKSFWDTLGQCLLLYQFFLTSNPTPPNSYSETVKMFWIA